MMEQLARFLATNPEELQGKITTIEHQVAKLQKRTESPGPPALESTSSIHILLSSAKALPYI